MGYVGGGGRAEWGVGLSGLRGGGGRAEWATWG